MSAFLPDPRVPRTDLPVELAWFGVSTFRLRVGDTVVFLDAYLDRVPEAAPVGLASREVTEADAVLVGHSHFDHLHGAQFIAAATGATIIGSYETRRLMAEAGVPDDQLSAASSAPRCEPGSCPACTRASGPAAARTGSPPSGACPTRSTSGAWPPPASRVPAGHRPR